ncbi:unnamed protein product [Calypogeia fissa]
MALHTRDSLLSLLKENGIQTATYDHPTVLTVEEQAVHVGHLEGGLCKNLLLKDKKNRLILVSALSTTKVDMKVLSQRLGVGKGGVRLAPEEIMRAVLKVPLGCVTPFALLNESARSVTLLLDEGCKSQPQLFLHPLSNDATTAISPSGLEKFLQIIGRQPNYVNLEEVVVVGKDQPPDLAVYLVDVTADVALKEQIASVKDTTAISEGASETVVKPVAKSKGKQKEATTAMKEVAKTSASDVQAIASYILNASKDGQQDFASELEGVLMALKNTAYTEGFKAGIVSRSMAR